MNGTQQFIRVVVVVCLALVSTARLRAQVSVEQPQSGNSKAATVPSTDSTSAQSAKLAETPNNAPATLCQCVGDVESESVKKIEHALRSPLHPAGLDFVEIKLRDVVKALQDDYQIPIRLDIVGLEEIGLNPEETVTINVKGVSLRSGLRILLHDLQLHYIIENETLLITTPQKAEEDFKTCVYNVSDLINARTEKEDIAALINVIIMSIGPSDVWDAKEEGDIKPLKPGLLVVKQTAEVHSEISELLAAIRKMRAASAPAREPDSKP